MSEHVHGGAVGAHTPVSVGARYRRTLVLVLGITLATLLAEVVGGLLSGSLALLADAGHLLTDAIGTEELSMPATAQTVWQSLQTVGNRREAA